MAEVYLGIANLKVLYETLQSAADRWYPFGEALKINKTTLDGLKSNDMDCSTLLLLVLSHYLSGTKQLPNPTKADVVAALRKVGFDDVASDLERNPIKATSEGNCLDTEDNSKALCYFLHFVHRLSSQDFGPRSARTSSRHEYEAYGKGFIACMCITYVEKDISCIRISISIQSLNITPFVSGKLRHPRGLAISSEGTYVADKGSVKNACVMRIHGNTENSSVVVRDPYGIALDDKAENVYVADCSSHRLYMFDEKLNFKKKIGTGKGGRYIEEFSYPHGVAVLRGMVYVCDNGNCRVKVYDQELNYKYSFGGRESEEHFDETTLFGPAAIAGDSKDGLYVADNKKMAIVKFRMKDNDPPVFVRNIEHKSLQMPSGITVDSYDFIYAIDRLSKCILVFQPTGTLVREFANDKLLRAPQAIYCVKGRPGLCVLYVSDADIEVNVWKCEIKYT